jgi:hypothetical protein
LVVTAEIAKTHTIEWTSQPLYDEPLYRAMNSNWSGLFANDFPLPDSYANVRRLAGRKGEVWGAESAADKLFMIKSE